MRKIFALLVITSLLFLNSLPAWAAFSYKTTVKSSSIEVEGVYIYKQKENKNQALQSAKADAKAKALKKFLEEYWLTYDPQKITKQEFLQLAGPLTKLEKMISQKNSTQGKKKILQIKACFILSQDQLQKKIAEYLSSKDLAADEQPGLVIYQQKF